MTSDKESRRQIELAGRLPVFLSQKENMEYLLVHMFNEPNMGAFKAITAMLVEMGDLRAAIPLFEIARCYAGERKHIAAAAFMKLLSHRFDFSGYSCASQNGKVLEAPHEDFNRTVARYVVLSALNPLDSSKLIDYIQGSDWIYCCEAVDVLAKYGLFDKRLIMPLCDCLLIPEVSQNAATILANWNYQDPTLISKIIWTVKYQDKQKQLESGVERLLITYGDLAVRPIVEELYSLNQEISSLGFDDKFDNWLNRLESLDPQTNALSPTMQFLKGGKERLFKVLVAIVGPGAVEAVSLFLNDVEQVATL